MSKLKYRSRTKLSSTSIEDLTTAGGLTPDQWQQGPPDRRDGIIYLFDELLKLALEVALATQRPLLLRGEPGSGKSLCAAFAARALNWRYYEQVVTARAQAQDFLWRFDHVRRLRDAQAKKESLADPHYIEPGIF